MNLYICSVERGLVFLIQRYGAKYPLVGVEILFTLCHG